MLYYRTHASRAGERPPELVQWTSPHANASLNEQVVGEHRVLAITPPFVFAAPTDGWVKLCAGWEVATVGEFNPLDHAFCGSKWLCHPTEIGSKTWLCPAVLNEHGTRSFKVIYGGPDFAPQMTAEQTKALALATEVRICLDGNTLPEMPQQARWAAQLLGLTYCLSPVSIGLVGIGEDLIDTVLRVAGGVRASGN